MYFYVIFVVSDFMEYPKSSRNDFQFYYKSFVFVFKFFYRVLSKYYRWRCNRCRNKGDEFDGNFKKGRKKCFYCCFKILLHKKERNFCINNWKKIVLLMKFEFFANSIDHLDYGIIICNVCNMYPQ